MNPECKKITNIVVQMAACIMLQVTVQKVDHGGIITVPVATLKAMPDKLQQLAHQVRSLTQMFCTLFKFSTNLLCTGIQEWNFSKFIYHPVGLVEFRKH